MKTQFHSALDTTKKTDKMLKLSHPVATREDHGSNKIVAILQYFFIKYRKIIDNSWKLFPLCILRCFHLRVKRS
jgi:hypothetical protein